MGAKFAVARQTAFVAAILLTVVLGNLAPQPIVAQTSPPHMQIALTDLGRAAYQLSIAGRDGAGHRPRALALTNQAILEVRAAIAAGVR